VQNRCVSLLGIKRDSQTAASSITSLGPEISIQYDLVFQVRSEDSLISSVSLLAPLRRYTNPLTSSFLFSSLLFWQVHFHFPVLHIHAGSRSLKHRLFMALLKAEEEYGFVALSWPPPPPSRGVWVHGAVMAATLVTLIGCELRARASQRPISHAGFAKHGKDYFLIKPDCLRVPSNLSSVFSVFAVRPPSRSLLSPLYSGAVMMGWICRCSTKHLPVARPERGPHLTPQRRPHLHRVLPFF
jgi:hypothetical protein